MYKSVGKSVLWCGAVALLLAAAGGPSHADIIQDDTYTSALTYGFDPYINTVDSGHKSLSSSSSVLGSASGQTGFSGSTGFVATTGIVDASAATLTSDGLGYAEIDFHVDHNCAFTLVDSNNSWNYGAAQNSLTYLYDLTSKTFLAALIDYNPGQQFVSGTLVATDHYALYRDSVAYGGAGYYGTVGAAGNYGFAAITTSSVPEPSSFALLCLGGIGLAFTAYRRRSVAPV